MPPVISVIGGCVSCGFALAAVVTSVVLASISAVEFNVAVDNVGEVAANWERSPVIDVSVRPRGGACPSGYVEYPMRDWPGSNSGPCACPTGADFYDDGRRYRQRSSGGTCTFNQSRAGCHTGPSLNGLDLQVWKDDTSLCLWREGPGAVFVNASQQLQERPVAVNRTACPTGWKPCGGDDTVGQPCFPTTLPCPLADYQVSTTVPDGYAGVPHTATPFVAAGSALRLYKRSADSYKGTPLSNDLLAYPFVVDAINSYDSVCRGDDGGRGWGRGSASGGTSHEGCPLGSSTDRRFVAAGTQPETDWMLPATAYDPDCTSPRSWMPAMPCEDSICSRTQGRDTCSRLREYATASSGQWLLSFRREVFWDANCPSSRIEITGSRDELDSARAGLIALAVFSGLFSVGNLVAAGWFFHALTDDEAFASYSVAKNLYTAASKALLLIPACVVNYVYVHKAARVYNDDLGTACTDEVTARALRTVVENVQSARDNADSTTATLAASAALATGSLLWRFVLRDRVMACLSRMRSDCTRRRAARQHHHASTTSSTPPGGSSVHLTPMYPVPAGGGGGGGGAAAAAAAGSGSDSGSDKGGGGAAAAGCPQAAPAAAAGSDSGSDNGGGDAAAGGYPGPSDATPPASGAAAPSQPGAPATGNDDPDTADDGAEAAVVV